MIKNIVFDLGNVLAKFDPYEIYFSYTNNKQEALDLYNFMYETNLWEDLDKGVEPINVITKIQGISPSKYHFAIEQIITTWIKALNFDPKMKDLVFQLKKNNFKVYMLSNISKQFYDFKKVNPIFNEFDGLYISADSQLIKPHAEVYIDFLETFGLTATESLFIDDKEINILGAKNLGFNVYHYQSDFDEFISYLNELISFEIK
jgi:putative hydrolase of the HAD superfamily